MEILKIKDKNTGQWINIPALKGEKGDTGTQGPTGPTGPKGEKGESGVYVGSGDMPEGYNIQIDPTSESDIILTDEDVKNIIIENTDNELNNISNNPISNSAVENALHTTYDTDVVDILFNTDYVEATANGVRCCYVIKNGICYVNLDFTPKTTLSNQETFVIFVPIPKISMCIECTPFNTEEHIRTGVINVTKIELEDGALGGFYGVSLMEGCRYMCSFSYPVEY